MKVFISYGSTGDQVTALRLQALGAVNGLTVYVPPAYTSQFGATVIVDDPWGYGLASGYDLECHGTVWIVQRFYKLNLLSLAAIRDSFVSLRDRGIRLPWNVADGFLAQIGRPDPDAPKPEKGKPLTAVFSEPATKPARKS